MGYKAERTQPVKYYRGRPQRGDYRPQKVQNQIPQKKTDYLFFICIAAKDVKSSVKDAKT